MNRKSNSQNDYKTIRVCVNDEERHKGKNMDGYIYYHDKMCVYYSANIRQCKTNMCVMCSVAERRGQQTT